MFKDGKDVYTAERRSNIFSTGCGWHLLPQISILTPRTGRGAFGQPDQQDGLEEPTAKPLWFRINRF
jgi:hypothetical protein